MKVYQIAIAPGKSLTVTGDEVIQDFDEIPPLTSKIFTSLGAAQDYIKRENYNKNVLYTQWRYNDLPAHVTPIRYEAPGSASHNKIVHWFIIFEIEVQS